MTATLPVLVAALAAFVGATLQRSTGMGFALVTSPFLILALGPVDGIVVTNCGTVATALVSAYQLRADFDAGHARWLIPAGLLGCVPGAAVVRLLPAAWVAVVVGAILLKERWPTFSPGGWAALAAAIAAGMVAGRIVHGRLNDRAAMRTVMTLALTGTMIALGKAVWALVS